MSFEAFIEQSVEGVFVWFGQSQPHCCFIQQFSLFAIIQRIPNFVWSIHINLLLIILHENQIYFFTTLD